MAVQGYTNIQGGPTEGGGGGASWTNLVDADFIAAANVDYKALGNGDHVVNGIPWTFVTVANSTSNGVINGTGLVWDVGAGPTQLNIRTPAFADAPLPASAAKAFLYRAKLYSTVSGMAGGEHYFVYWTDIAQAVRTGFSRTATNWFTVPSSANFGAVGATDYTQVTGLCGSAALWSGASEAAAVPRGSCEPGFDDTSCWNGQVPQFGMRTPVGPYVWTITRIVIDWMDPSA